MPDAPPFEPVETWPGLTDMSRLQKMIWAAERPIVLLGGSRWSDAACASVQRFAERFALPVATTFRRAHLFDPDHPCYAGDLGIGPNPKLLARVKGADLIVLVGGRLGEMPSQGYTLLDIPAPSQKLVHVFPDVAELGRVYRAELAINAAPTAFAAALEGLQPPNDLRWADDTPVAHADFLAWTDKPTKVPGAVNMGEIVTALRAKLPADAVITNGAGNFSVWVHRYSRYRRYGTELAPISGSMGYGVPAAVGMKRLAPERTVVCFAGDGDFLMTGQEFATAMQYDLPVIIVVMDNGMYGTIRMHQERHYPGRVVGTALKNPDFAAYARSLRRLRCDGGEDRRLHAGVRGGAEVGQARDHPRQGRSRGAHARDVALCDPREGVGGEALNRVVGERSLSPPHPEGGRRPRLEGWGGHRTRGHASRRVAAKFTQAAPAMARRSSA